MGFSLSTPVTGAAQTGFTSPTYTVASDNAPDINAKQWAVTALGGTQAGVVAHSVSAPFTISQFRPKNPQTLKALNKLTGQLDSVGMNTYKTITRKGVLPLAGQAYRTMRITTVIECPAGADTADAANVRAALSAHLGALAQQSAGLGDTIVTGVL